ncbi:gamma-glutamyl-gamma-aminobutyrate hydrolase family protein [Ancylobacter sp. 6x-1]|uniref:Gamma-glutamyl-gamma-aminobutyrate hydrolase family protein n=1 Tax=Ancylobacter crimeensis TaxID=2579147 RepID=A0ABT0DD29_9HYPH|nr:gamma-glutamyl-gamma-aminobutyrate hydrolase family protein [Ancylobacter crimeensis]MCK0197857.1 gamma-glutamyl-gamma-aminobutyrate hydrolase family protein [Ancylobacter crimeensis]
MRQLTRPVIGVISDVKPGSGHVTHGVTEKYLFAVARGADTYPVMLPGRMSDVDGSMSETAVLEEIFALVDGIFLPGSPSNVEPALYGGTPYDPPLPADPHRDVVSLPLIRACVERGVPLFGVCRGFQEMNVALGGSLHQKVHEQPGHFDHREDGTRSIEEQYGHAHEVSLAPGGLLAGLAGAGRWSVNSLHGQGIDRLAPRLAVEARADDGLVEAFRVQDAPGFALAVQWHPEWRFWQDRLSAGLFEAFGAAARAYAAQRRGDALKAAE